MAPDDTKPLRIGNLKPGDNGNPKRISAERLLAKSIPALLERAIELALGGDKDMIKLVLEYGKRE